MCFELLNGMPTNGLWLTVYVFCVEINDKNIVGLILQYKSISLRWEEIHVR